MTVRIRKPKRATEIGIGTARNVITNQLLAYVDLRDTKHSLYQMVLNLDQAKALRAKLDTAIDEIEHDPIRPVITGLPMSEH